MPRGEVPTGTARLTLGGSDRHRPAHGALGETWRTPAARRSESSSGPGTRRSRPTARSRSLRSGCCVRLVPPPRRCRQTPTGSGSMGVWSAPSLRPSPSSTPTRPTSAPCSARRSSAAWSSSLASRAPRHPFASRCLEPPEGPWSSTSRRREPFPVPEDGPSSTRTRGPCPSRGTPTTTAADGAPLPSRPCSPRLLPRPRPSGRVT